ncbi:hypothetical protein FJZ40_03340 [Candidatus Shapirobacteria bacterium]|nr:hypothetical protein [Candidatus Shapirobacteria bacterium]
MGNGLILHELVHFSITLLVAFFCGRRYKKWGLVIVALVFGIFIDVDHWFDYLMYYGWQIDLGRFFEVEKYVMGSGKIYVLLHGWEYLVIWGLLGWLIENKSKMRGLTLTILGAYLGHILWDQFSFSHHPLAYFLAYRVLNNFSLGSFNGF